MRLGVFLPNWVGDVVMAAFSTSLGFTYSCAIEATTGGEQSIPSGVVTAVKFGQGAPDGSFTQTVLTPPDGSGIGAVGVFIREARSGVVYYPLRSTKPILIAPKHSKTFRLRCTAPSASCSSGRCCHELSRHQRRGTYCRIGRGRAPQLRQSIDQHDDYFSPTAWRSSQ